MSAHSADKVVGLRSAAHAVPAPDSDAWLLPVESQPPATAQEVKEPVLQLQDFSVAYGLVQAVHPLALNVAAGEILTVIGPNGAGKTTLLSAVMGLLPSRGRLTLDGEVIVRPTVEAMVARGVALVPESRELFSAMSVADNLLLGGFSRRARGGRAGDRLDRVYDIFPRLRERRTQLAGTLSGGERQMLAIGRALMSEPRLLMLDEPSLGLAPRIVRDVLAVVSELRRTGVAVLLVEQNARAALRVADHACVLEMGQVALEGPASALMHDPRIVAAYLGMGTS